MFRSLLSQQPMTIYMWGVYNLLELRIRRYNHVCPGQAHGGCWGEVSVDGKMQNDTLTDTYWQYWSCSDLWVFFRGIKPSIRRWWRSCVNYKLSASRVLGCQWKTCSNLFAVSDQRTGELDFSCVGISWRQMLVYLEDQKTLAFYCGQSQSYLITICSYDPLDDPGSYWKWPFIMSVPTKKGDFP